MKTKINLLVVCFVLACVSMVPQVAQAQDPPFVLTPPCSVASLTGGFGYSVRGTIGVFNFNPRKNTLDDTRAQVGLLNFDGLGGFTNTFTEAVLINPFTGSGDIERNDVTQGTYQISFDCKTGKFVFHGGFDPEDCVHYDVAFKTTAVLLGTLVPGPPRLLFADATLKCTDFLAQKWNPITKTYSSLYTGTMAQQ